VNAIDGISVPEPMFIFPVDRFRLEDGRVAAFHAPLMPAFYLFTAKELRDVGEKERKQVLGSLVPEPRPDYADVNVSDDSLVMDAVGKLGSAVILAAGAIEAYANEAVERLPDDATVTIERRGVRREIPRADMVRRLALDEKLDLIVPLVSSRPSIKGRDPWPRFRRLNELRGEVVHVKSRGRTDDPDVPSVLGRLLLGEGSTCVEDAAAVIVACEPNWLSRAAKEALGIEPGVVAPPR
jgi:hypothetical protein